MTFDEWIADKHATPLFKSYASAGWNAGWQAALESLEASLLTSTESDKQEAVQRDFDRGWFVAVNFVCTRLMDLKGTDAEVVAQIVTLINELKRDLELNRRKGQ